MAEAPDDLSKIEIAKLSKLLNKPINSYENFYMTNQNYGFIHLELKNSELRLFLLLADMLTNGTQVKSYNNNKPIQSIEDVVTILDISDRTFSRARKNLEDKRLVKFQKIGDEMVIHINPAYIIYPNFMMTTQIYDLFKIDILQHLDFLLWTIQDSETFNHIKSDIKPLISSHDYSTLEFRFSVDSYVIIDDVVKSNGIYVLYNNDEIVYIGKSKNIKNRIMQHKSNKKFDSVKSIIFKDEGLINLYEPYLIQKYKPKYNKDLLEEINFELPNIKLETEGE